MGSQARLDAVVQAACEGATVVTGNTRAARSVTARCDLRLNSGAGTWKTPDVLPWAQWVQRTFRSAQVAGATESALLNRRQAESLWRQSIANTPGLTDLLKPSSASGAAAQAWALAHAYRIKIGPSLEATAQGRAFLGWARRYESQLKKLQCVDPATVADELARSLTKIERRLPKKLVRWACGEATPQDAALLAALRAAGVEIVEMEVESAAATTATRLRFDDTDEELRRVAAFARDRLRRDPDAKIGIVIPNLRGMRAQVEQTFLRVLQPEFFVGQTSRRAFEISLGEPLAQHSLVRTALLMLRLSIEELRWDEVKELMTSPWLAGAAKEADGRAQLCHWLARRVPEKLSAARLESVLGGKGLDRRETAELERFGSANLRKTVNAVAHPRKMPSRAGMSEWAQRLEQWLKDAGWNVDGERKLDSTSFQATTKWLEMLSESASLDVTQGPVTMAEAVREILSAAKAQTFAPENQNAPVQIMDVREAEGSVLSHLWICGLDDETWPPATGGDPFIPLFLQREAKVPRSSRESQIEEAGKTLGRLLGAAPEVFVSHAAMADERELRMSPAIETANDATWEELGIQDAPDWRESMRGGAVEEFTDAQAPAFTAEELLHRGTSLLEKQSICPFRAYAELRLGAVKTDEPAPGVEPRLRGLVIEKMLEGFWVEAIDLGNYRKLGAEERERSIRRAVEGAMREVLPAPQDRRDQKVREIEGERLAALLDEWIEVEEARTRFDKIRHQMEFEYEVGGVKLKGKIDRVDHSIEVEGEVVIDYKASTASQLSSKGWETPRPLLPQLPLYAVYRKREKQEVVGVAFGKLGTGKCEYKGLAESEKVFGRPMGQRWTKLSLGELITQWELEIERLVKEHMAGAAAVDPKVPPSKSNSSCDRCHLKSLCRVAEVVTFGGDDEGGEDE